MRHLFLLPRRLAVIPLILAFAWMTRDPVLELDSVKFTLIRVLVAVGFVRVLLRRESLAGGINRIDLLWLLWALWLSGSNLFHESNNIVFRVGMIWDAGSYVLFRIFLQASKT